MYTYQTRPGKVNAAAGLIASAGLAGLMYVPMVGTCLANICEMLGTAPDKKDYCSATYVKDRQGEEWLSSSEFFSEDVNGRNGWYGAMSLPPGSIVEGKKPPSPEQWILTH